MSHKVILVGASGLIGSHLLQALIKSTEVSGIVLLLRKPLNISDDKIQQVIVNFDHLNNYTSEIQGDIIFSCLGTTKALSPNAEVYKKIDLEYPLQLAEIGIKNGVSSFHIVSSLGANSTSSNSYLRLKGNLEEKLKKLPFKSLHLYQPSLLTGIRKDFRFGEKAAFALFALIDPLLIGSLRKYRSIKAETVAVVMLKQSLKELSGIFTYPSIQIQELA